MTAMVKGEIDKIILLDPNNIQRDMSRLILLTTPQRNKYLKCTTKEKRFKIDYDDLSFVTYPFGFRFSPTNTI